MSLTMKSLLTAMWNFIFDHDKSPLRHISDFNVRHMVFQMLGWMGAISFSLAIGTVTLSSSSVSLGVVTMPPG